MPFFPGTGPQALRDLFIDEYQPQRAGRPDLPPLIEDPATDFGVRVLADREAVNHQRATTDLIHCLHPENNPMDRVDQGFKEERVTEYVQVDISVSDRTDPDTGERLSARERLVGTREQQLETYGFTLGGTDGTTYGGDAWGHRWDDLRWRRRRDARHRRRDRLSGHLRRGVVRAGAGSTRVQRVGHGVSGPDPGDAEELPGED
jgi:hypothetical protein